MKHRLYLQIYAGFVAVAILCVAVAWGSGRLLYEGDSLPPQAAAAAAYLAADVDRGTPLSTLSDRLHLALALWDAGGLSLDDAGGTLTAPRLDGPATQWRHDHGGPSIAVHLADGRWIGAGFPWQRQGHQRYALVLVALLSVTAAGCYPVARRITRRIERLQQGVERWGDGALGARVRVDGHDEVAELARSFNGAADRIEALVQGQRRVLASASHELRSPLARLRMAVELLDDDGRRSTIAEGASRDIAELDALIGDLLLASRLDAQERVERPERVELLALAAEEGARVGANVTGTPVEVMGDARMLRRLLRNLFENARRHGGGDVSARVEPGATVTVEDRGPGVPEGERERIFEPFYRPAGHHEGADGGVGLGLALVRRIARHHGGDVRYVPREGGGGSFALTLPAATRHPW